ncbi:hypothetical protein BJX70DRAFT_57399 [Aspergillus crustosus]
MDPQTQESPEHSLQAHIFSLHSLPLSPQIQALHTLLPHLTTSVSPTATRLITHPTLSGPGDLDTLGRIYLRAADQCTDEHAPFRIRLEHVALDEMMLNLYEESHDLMRSGLKNGSVVYPPRDEKVVESCACCRGDPDAVILSGFVDEDSLWFYEEEYKRIWPGEEESGYRCWGGGESGPTEVRLKTSREQVERMLKKENEEAAALSKL